MTRETRTGPACAAVVLATMLAVLGAFAAGVASLPERLIAAADGEAQP
ncbi:hypothetical protein [Caulobacter segnis]|nr:hypothetical protein [Caulobacter segnis]